MNSPLVLVPSAGESEALQFQWVRLFLAKYN